MATPLRDNVSRNKNLNLLGTSIFVGLRAAHVFLQYGLLKRGWASSFIEFLGGRSVERGLVVNAATTQLQPYYGAISLMALGSSLKQIFHLAVISEQEMPPVSAITIPVFNTVFNSLNTIFSLWAVTSQVPAWTSLADAYQSPWLLLSTGLYLVGIMTELVSELQRT
ncbi:hypothetical protein QQX98_008614 [Neonectria punicea]|uniref:Uncharacterized protein n=1 Tax=Neonectria punicea TaxID=979145 RepID=A0ABR1GVU8_9HYPO